MSKFLNNNTWQFKLLRTIVQAILGFVVNNLAMIVASTPFDPTVQAIIVTATMAILAPIMAQLGMRVPEKPAEIKDAD